MRTLLASAPAVLSDGPNARVLREPNVPLSKGQRSVSPMTMSTSSMFTSSSSASIWARDVTIPCPISILPV